MLPKNFFDVLNHEGVVTVISWGDTEEPHFANTWNSYLVITEDERILIPAYGFRVTERNVNRVGKIKMSLGSKEVKGYKDYQETGFYLEGTARFLSEGPDYDRMKEKYDFLTRVLEITPTFVQQKI